MVKLSDAIGALLKDITYARVKSDLFSRDASLEYLKDPVLKLFPVPRVEIRNVEIDLAFGISEVRQEGVDPSSRLLPRLLEKIRDLAISLLGIPVRKSHHSRDLVPLEERLGEVRRNFLSELTRRIEERVRRDAATLIPQLLEQPGQAGKSLAQSLLPEVRASLGTASLKIPLSAETQARIEELTVSWASEASRDLKPAGGEEQPDAFHLDVAVTKEELAGLPPNALTRVKVSVDIQNYEWIQVEDEDGRVVPKLVPR